MLVVRNDDRAGMIGVVGTILGEAGVSISSMAVGPSATGNTALMVLSTDQLVPGDALERLRGSAGISDVHTVQT
jgi:D-3-phosphoglycerate dehydrogenase